MKTTTVVFLIAAVAVSIVVETLSPDNAYTWPDKTTVIVGTLLFAALGGVAAWVWL